MTTFQSTLASTVSNETTEKEQLFGVVGPEKIAEESDSDKSESSENDE